MCGLSQSEACLFMILFFVVSTNEYKFLFNVGKFMTLSHLLTLLVACLKILPYPKVNSLLFTHSVLHNIYCTTVESHHPPHSGHKQ